VAIYASAIFVSALFRNYYIFLGYAMAVKMRKVFVSAMYDKVGNLSMKSLTETNSGKLITLISSDIFIVERAITMTPFILASPFIVILCLFLIYLSSEWFYVISTLIVWLLCIGAQYICSLQTKSLKQKESILNDQRMKLVNDMVVGIRTIKSYAWENHYLAKIVEIRTKQTNIILRYNMVGSLSYSLFQNFGLVAVIVIFVTKWMREEVISQAECFSLLAMIYFLFFSITSMTLYAMNTLQQVMVLMQRLSEIFCMEEFKMERIENVQKSEVCIKMKDAAFSWGFRVQQD
jgi:ABC-type multidrug transport system fused ATPase/permease subunit